ncbi:MULTISPECIES: sugar O-acetyltransferase [unclassified Corynebacterium]|uniref:sugar O-acetyltransferase n=1 Tax=unclassified Corynebacterium TaxID=2624378 RepID=UPI0026498FFC|nr:sugar O-acetyltransferase [Corynebacterium sp.]MDN5583152.1 sugar O-acetyltransferase [Corynebacterium sp.]MDN5720893.1 sugar O-acetyltransferase [Corynebacterium sp.]MDN6386626.1 sugar O-acetyltransferase [Corynebacterium sp.]MDN6510556.1 sugar O-acetyltransferase [Corynebacterium sp.]
MSDSTDATATTATTATSLRAAVDADPRSMWERMVAGEYYLADEPDVAARSACFRLSQTDPANADSWDAQVRDLLGHVGERSQVWPGLRVDYGTNVHLGDDVFINVDATILDVCPVRIGDHCQIGPGAQFLTPLHPLEDHELRATGWEYGAPITLGRNVWFGGRVTVCAGVTIGDNVVVGAGSVVTRDLPSDVLAVGTPATVVREL